MSPDRFLVDACEPEVGHLYLELVAHKDVRGAQVSVNEVVCLVVRHAIRHLREHVDELCKDKHCGRLALQKVEQRAVGHQLRDDVDAQILTGRVRLRAHACAHQGAQVSTCPGSAAASSKPLDASAPSSCTIFGCVSRCIVFASAMNCSGRILPPVRAKSMVGR